MTKFSNFFPNQTYQDDQQNKAANIDAETVLKIMKYEKGIHVKDLHEIVKETGLSLPVVPWDQVKPPSQDLVVRDYTYGKPDLAIVSGQQAMRMTK